MTRITAVIITYNEEYFIERCLASLEGIADEIIVVDSYSTDSTEEICKRHNVRFVKHAFEGYRDQKNYALTLATHKTILSLDADEALSDQLRQSILAVKENPEYDGYIFNRQNFYCGKWIRHSEWYPNRQLRLFDSEKGRFGELNIHEKFIMANGGATTILDGDLIHWACVSRQDHINKMTMYSDIGAEEFHKAGKKAGILTPYFHCVWGFFRTYFINRGFLDGHDGFLICSVYARSVFNKYKKLRELNKNRIKK